VGYRYMEISGASHRTAKSIVNPAKSIVNPAKSIMNPAQRVYFQPIFVLIALSVGLSASLLAPAGAEPTQDQEKGSASSSGTSSVAGRVQVLPRDEAHRDPALIKFRQRLLHIVRRRDSEALENCLSKDVLAGLGGGIGKDNFYEVWKPEKNTDFWTKLSFALSHGGFFESDSQQKFTAPYFDFYPDSLADPDTSGRGIIIDEDVELKDRPGGATLGHLSFELVHLLDGRDGAGEWRHVKSFGGQSGYVKAAEVRSQAEPFAEFTRHGNRWFLSSFGSASP
jgi:hypothetical protein